MHGMKLVRTYERVFDFLDRKIDRLWEEKRAKFVDRKIEDILKRFPNLREVYRKHMRMIIVFFKYFFDDAVKNTQKVIFLAKSQNAKQILFFGRDSLPFYMIAKRIAGPDVKIKYLDFSRDLAQDLMYDPNRKKALKKFKRLLEYYKIDFNLLNKTLLVDSGFFGSVPIGFMDILEEMGIKSKLKYPIVIYSLKAIPERQIKIDSRNKKESFILSLVQNRNILAVERHFGEMKRFKGNEIRSLFDTVGLVVESIPKQYDRVTIDQIFLREKPVRRNFYIKADITNEEEAEKYIEGYLGRKFVEMLFKRLNRMTFEKEKKE